MNVNDQNQRGAARGGSGLSRSFSQNHAVQDTDRSIVGAKVDAERGGGPLWAPVRLLPCNAPIGVFDSGAGGLTILSALQEELPHERYLYFADTAHCPYGMRTDAEITELSIAGCRFLIEQGAKLVVVACNTASQAALSALRATFPSVPFVGVVPAVKPAARATRTGHIGVAATNHASKAVYLRHLIDQFAAGIQVYTAGCPELVTLVEEGKLDGPVVEETVRQALLPLLQQDIDVLVLGCTHFPALRPVIERVVGQHVLVIDSGAAVARRTRAVLEAEGLACQVGPGDTGKGELQIWCSGDPVAFSGNGAKILGYSIDSRAVQL